MNVFVAFLLAGTACAMPVLQIPQPDSTYISETMLLPISEPEGSIISSESEGFLTIAFLFAGMSTLMDVNQVPTSWMTWGSPPNTESSTPKVVRPDDTTQTGIVFAFSIQLSIFGMELEPDDTTPGNMHLITATYFLGSTPVGTIARSVSGDGGALLFAGSGGPFDSVEVVSDIDFAAAQFRYAPADVPELPTGVLLFFPLAAMVAWHLLLRRNRPSA
jgi:hypothetical protein